MFRISGGRRKNGDIWTTDLCALDIAFGGLDFLEFFVRNARKRFAMGNLTAVVVGSQTRCGSDDQRQQYRGTIDV